MLSQEVVLLACAFFSVSDILRVERVLEIPLLMMNSVYPLLFACSVTHIEGTLVNHLFISITYSMKTLFRKNHKTVSSTADSSTVRRHRTSECCSAIVPTDPTVFVHCFSSSWHIPNGLSRPLMDDDRPSTHVVANSQRREERSFFRPLQLFLQLRIMYGYQHIYSSLVPFIPYKNSVTIFIAVAQKLSMEIKFS